MNFHLFQNNNELYLNNNVLLTSLKAQKLISLSLNGDKVLKEEVLYEREGRMRDIEINSKGEIFIIIDDSVTS